MAATVPGSRPSKACGDDGLAVSALPAAAGRLLARRIRRIRRDRSVFCSDMP
jgi:hypothetical protein